MEFWAGCFDVLVCTQSGKYWGYVKHIGYDRLNKLIYGVLLWSCSTFLIHIWIFVAVFSPYISLTLAWIYLHPCSLCFVYRLHLFVSMAHCRSKSLESSEHGNRRRRMCKPLTPETPGELKAKALALSPQSRLILPWCYDNRGNALSVKSLGHIHHPLNQNKCYRWLYLVDHQLARHTYGLRHPLHYSLPVYMYDGDDGEVRMFMMRSQVWRM